MTPPFPEDTLRGSHGRVHSARLRRTRRYAHLSCRHLSPSLCLPPPAFSATFPLTTFPRAVIAGVVVLVDLGPVVTLAWDTRLRSMELPRTHVTRAVPHRPDTCRAQCRRRARRPRTSHTVTQPTADARIFSPHPRIRPHNASPQRRCIIGRGSDVRLEVRS